MCACRCGIRVHLRDDNGEVRYIDGNPDHPLNKGVICAKGSAGIMKQVSPARLTQPLLRKPGSERGAGEFEPISWERAFELLTERLGRIRATDPKKFALFTGRDQMQALTGLFARQFGTPNYAAHGGFCSVNMAAGMIYTVGGSFWEFGGPDLDRAKLFVMIGTAEDHHSNPMKIAISKFKRAGGRFISINPVRTGYSAIADEWIPIRPGTDGALFMALLHELIRTDLIDRPSCKRFTNAPQLVVLDEGEREGLFAFDPAAGPPGDGRNPHNKLVWDLASGRVVKAYPEGIAEGLRPGAGGPLQLADGTRVAPSFQLLRDRVADLHARVGRGHHRHPAERIRQLAASWGRRRCSRPSSCPSPGPTPGASSTPPRRAAGGLPRDARAGGAFQRLPDGARAGGADERAGHHRRARRLPPQGAVPAPHRAELPGLQRPVHDQAQHAAERGAAGFSRRPRTSWRCTRTARRSASTTRSPGSTRCRPTG
jgi:anaerobic selenocysteine-containing dehydrogenase